MTLDEAIAKAKADGDVQLAEWLRQARGADAGARWYTEKLRDANRTIRKLLAENSKASKLEAENARLRELVSDYSDCLDTALWLASDAGYPVMPARDKFLSLEKRKREMGIEVE